MFSKEYAALRCQLINPDKAMVYPSTGNPKDFQTKGLHLAYTRERENLNFLHLLKGSRDHDVFHHKFTKAGGLYDTDDWFAYTLIVSKVSGFLPNICFTIIVVFSWLISNSIWRRLNGILIIVTRTWLFCSVDYWINRFQLLKNKISAILLRHYLKYDTKCKNNKHFTWPCW